MATYKLYYILLKIHKESEDFLNYINTKVESEKCNVSKITYMSINLNYIRTMSTSCTKSLDHRNCVSKFVPFLL